MRRRRTTGAARRHLPRWLWALVLPAACGVLVGAAWWLLAPTAPVQVALAGRVLLVQAPSRPELDAAQDGTLALLGLGAGVVTGVVVAAAARVRPLTTTLLAAVGAAAGSALALVTGTWLGPASLADQGALGVDTPDGSTGADGSLVSPLVVHALAVLVVWPLITLLVAAIGHAVVGWRLGRAAEDAAVADEGAEAHEDHGARAERDPGSVEPAER